MTELNLWICFIVGWLIGYLCAWKIQRMRYAPKPRDWSQYRTLREEEEDAKQ